MEQQRSTVKVLARFHERLIKETNCNEKSDFIHGSFLGVSHSYGAENASNPLAAVNNTDVRWQYFDLGDSKERNDFYVADGSYMLTPKLKLKYELHYWDTDVTGSSESDWESLHLKPIYFPKQGEWGEWK